MSDLKLSGLLFCAAFLVRLVAWMGAAIFGTDGCHYLLMADWMGAGRWSEALSLSYHPMYPLLIAIARIPLDDTIRAGGLVSVTLGAAAVLPLFHVVRGAIGRPEAFVASLLYAFNPSIIDAQSDVLTEGAFVFFFIASMALTWRMMEEPTLSRAAVLGAFAAAAYLTRPEGLLAVTLALAWPLVDLIRRRDRRGLRAGGLALTLVVVLLAVFPYLLWVKSVKGHWDWSPRSSAASLIRSAGTVLNPSVAEEARSSLFGSFAKAIYRVTYLVTIPFYLLGFFELWKRRGRPALFLLSFPLLYLGGVLFTLRAYDFMSVRYVIPAMSVLLGVAALGLTAALRGLARRRPEPLLGAALLLLIAVLPCVRALNPTRWECLGYYTAARWIETQRRPRAMSGPIQQVAYLSGCPSVYSATTPEGVRRQVREGRVDYYVYTEKDLEKRPEYVEMLRSCDVLEAPVEIVGPPGTWKLYVQRAK